MNKYILYFEFKFKNNEYNSMLVKSKILILIFYLKNLENNWVFNSIRTYSI